MKKSLKTFLILMLCTFLAALCGVFAGCNVDYEAMYNDDAKILGGNSYSAYGRVKNVHARTATISCMSFSGIDTVFTSLEIDGGLSADLTLSYTGDNGKLKIVLTGNNKVYTVAEAGWVETDMFIEPSNGIIDFGDIPYGNYKLKIVGVKAEFSLKLNLV